MDWKSYNPIAASDMAASWEQLHLFLLAVCVFFFLVVMVPMLIFAIKYRYKPGRKVSYFTHNFALEVTWTVIPTIILMVIFAWGWLVYKDMVYDVPGEHQVVRVVAKSWNWTFQYEDGRTTTNEMYVPVDTPIKIQMTSQVSDVLHSFYVPNLRIKKDAVPGMYTSLWFTAKVVGQHQIFCTEYCGAGHSAMLAKLVVLSKKDYQLWTWGKEIELPPAIGVSADLSAHEVYSIDESPPPANAVEETVAQVVEDAEVETETVSVEVKTSLVEQGKRIAQTRGCVACHAAVDRPGLGPSYVGLFGSEVELEDGSRVTADENYLRESIENPQAKIVKGYEKVLMPPYPGMLSELELNALIAYIKSLK